MTTLNTQTRIQRDLMILAAETWDTIDPEVGHMKMIQHKYRQYLKRSTDYDRANLVAEFLYFSISAYKNSGCTLSDFIQLASKRVNFNLVSFTYTGAVKLGYWNEPQFFISRHIDKMILIMINVDLTKLRSCFTDVHSELGFLNSDHSEKGQS